jgi:hypothetical protein
MTEEQIEIELSEIDGIDISKESISELEEMVDECAKDVDSMTEEFGERIDEHLKKINNSPVYEELGLELTIDMDYEFSLDERGE